MPTEVGVRQLKVLGPLAALLLLARPALAQQEDLPAVFSEVIDVRVVNVEVVVTDRAGNRVHGLEASDFELLVDGEPTPITYFSEVEEGFALDSKDGDVAAVPGLGPNEPVGTNFLIFIDDLFSIERDRNRVLDRLEADLGELGPVDRLAAVAFDGTRVETLTTWTNSASQFGEALDRARKRPAHGLGRRSEQRMVDSDRESVNQFERSLSIPRDVSSLASRAEVSYEETLSDQMERSVLAAVATMPQFAGQPGRKVMLLLAGGWPRSVAIYALQSLPTDRPPTDRRVMSEDKLYGPLVSTANLTGFSLYPVDLPGPTRDFRGDASRGLGPDPRTGDVRATPGSLEREDSLHSTLQLLARSTGGVPMINAERDAALAAAVADTRSYYWLGFEPQRRDDEAYHEIVVRPVNRPDLTVRTREGYVDRSRDREIEMAVEAALMFGDPPGARPLDVRIGEPARAGRRRMSVPLEVAIPLDEIQLLPVAGVWQNELEVRVTAMDLEGNRADVSVEKVPIAGSSEPQPGQVFYYQTNLQLRRREHTYVVAVYDPLTGTSLTSTGTIGPE